MKKIDLTNINKLTPPFFVTTLRPTILGLNENLELKTDDVISVIAILDSTIIIQSKSTVRTAILSAFRLSYKNEERLCKS